MFEKYLSDVLVERFGRYINGLDTDNLQVSTLAIEPLLNRSLRVSPNSARAPHIHKIALRWL